jgi:hypothetical protein
LRRLHLALLGERLPKADRLAAATDTGSSSDTHSARLVIRDSIATEGDLVVERERRKG